jgi:hypothetical protein
MTFPKKKDTTDFTDTKLAQYNPLRKEEKQIPHEELSIDLPLLKRDVYPT